MTETISGPARKAGKGQNLPAQNGESGRQRSGGAGRPGKSRLRIERVFTKPGVHPYDEITWERRDVVMTNWRDGSVNFEQYGVEYPDFWSVNAANIVTTKYFRGALGTERREWSLKQVIDRVVKTYRAAGEKYGYFVAPEDAEIFEHELTHALVHQVFAFNSPVWFNVGTASPQQVSACQPYDALVTTAAGLVPIGRLVEGDAVGTKIYDAHGLTTVVATKHNGVKEVLRITTKSGHVLDVTRDHLVWRHTGQGSGRFVEAGTLEVGDQLNWHRRFVESEQDITELAMAEAALAGWLQSDGFVGQYEAGTNRSLTIEAMTVTDAELDWVTRALDEVFPDIHRKERLVETLDQTLDCRRTRLYGKGLADFVERWGLRARGTDMVVPEQLFTAPLPVVSSYLRSVFQAEGFVSVRKSSVVVEVDMVGEKLIRGMQQLLGRFGIFARVGFKRGNRPDQKGTWTLRIQNAGDRKLFAGHIGFIDPKKADRLEQSLTMVGREAKELKVLEIASIESRGEMDVYDIQTDSGEYLSGSLRVHNCFILAVDDTMDSILNWYREEGLIFKGGSGAGLNLSRIRSSKELLSSGGNASGPVSFMRGADASAGTIKSGGATRRAAKMVVLDVDHPDVQEFIQTKAREEDKIRALRDAGFDMDLGGADITSVQYQNANNSVRVSNLFMKTYEQGGEFGLRARGTGEVIETVDAGNLFRQMAQAAWECADPGIQYDDTINEWHTNPNSGRINASNPCFPADQRVVTDKGLVQIGDLVARAARGETFEIYTNDVTAESDAADRIVATRPVRYMVTGTNEIVELTLSDGSRLRCTPNHRLWTKNRGWVRAEELTENDRVVRSLQHAARPMASGAIPAAAVDIAHASGIALPMKWEDEDLAHYMGWLLGDGCLTDMGAVTVYGPAEEQDDILPRHRSALTRWTGFEPKPSVQANGTRQLRSKRGAVREYFEALGVGYGRAADRRVPATLFEAPEYALVDFLQGLFDADGCVVNQKNGTRYVGLGSKSEGLLRDVQELLASLGIAAKIYMTAEKKEASFPYTRKDGSEVAHSSDGPFYDLRISGRSIREFAILIDFTVPSKRQKLIRVIDDSSYYNTDETVRLVSRVSAGFETTYNLTEPRNHSYIVNGVVVANCSEYLSLDNSSCNLASLNLLKFLKPDDTFDSELFAKVVELVITAMDISISFADFPTPSIRDNTRAFRQLGIGYANLGALLMAIGKAYDSDEGRAAAAAITALMTGTAYKRSAELAGIVGPYDGYAANAEPHANVMRKHAAAADELKVFEDFDSTILDAARDSWAKCLEIGAANGWRNAQASVLAPTGCLTADTLVTTDRGLFRLDELGEVYGDRWQDVDFQVSTDNGVKQATKFFVNGEEPTRRIVTEGGYKLQGTTAHRVKVVNQESGEWEWKRLADVASGDIVPIQLRTLVGASREVPLPVLDQAYYTDDRRLYVPDFVDADLAELVGYFMGDGSLHAKGLRFCVADTDLDVAERLSILGKGLFGIQAAVTQCEGYQEVAFHSVRLARWWQAAGFAKLLPSEDHAGKGWTPRVPTAIREVNNEAVYAAFLRGLFEAGGTVLESVPSFSTASESFADEIRSLLLVLGLATTTRKTVSGYGGPISQVRLRNLDHAIMYDELVGFMGERKSRLLPELEPEHGGKKDRIHLSRAVWDDLVPIGHRLRGLVVSSLAKSGGVSRTAARAVFAETLDDRLAFALDYLYEPVTSNEDGGVQPTYDISVPENVTYVANGFVSHNTIGFMMDCDTTGVEPDLALVKFKKLVGGGSMQIVNNTVPRALKRLGYQQEQIEAIVEFIAEHGHVVDAPGLKPRHYAVFDCAMGDRSIEPMGHVHMMAAVQPFISGSISKTVNMPETATVEDIEEIYYEGWKLGLKALAVYRNNCKVGQPLQDAKGAKRAAAAEAAARGDFSTNTTTAEAKTVVEHSPVRKRLPKSRLGSTTSFKVGGAEGYMIANSYPDDGLGEVFLKMSKQGSTLAGMMDAFSVAISVGLQYGVPLETYISKFTNMRFEPAGLTDDPDVRMAQSILDYIFRRLALDYLPFDVRADYGIYSASERQRELETGSYLPAEDEQDLTEIAQSAPIEKRAPKAEAQPAATSSAAVEPPHTINLRAGSSMEVLEAKIGHAADAPLCFTCGTKMRPAGSCYVCEGCGSTSGCS
jgi:ribonucleoside-diphosphate reductase alpha chain